MGEPARVEAWVRGRFVALPGATVEHLRANVWSVRLRRDPATARALRLREVSLEQLDELVLAIDGQEAVQVVPTAESDAQVELTVLLDL